MCFHVIQTHVETSKHVGKFRIANSVSGPWGIQSAGRRIQKVIVVEIVLNAIRKFGVSFLGRKQSFALFLEVGRLGFD